MVKNDGDVICFHLYDRNLLEDYLFYNTKFETPTGDRYNLGEIYKNNGYDIALVQRLLQHSSAAITQRYIGIEPQRIEAAIEGHAQLL